VYETFVQMSPQQKLRQGYTTVGRYDEGAAVRAAKSSLAFSCSRTASVQSAKGALLSTSCDMAFSNDDSAA